MKRKPHGIVAFALNDTPDHTGTALLRSERDTAIRDLIELSDVELVKFPKQYYHVTLTCLDKKLVFRFDSESGEELATLVLSPSPYRRLIDDYFMMVESYEQIRAEGNLQKLEAVDMGRRAIHNEAAELIQSRLKDKISMDFESARRFFTLICVLQA